VPEPTAIANASAFALNTFVDSMSRSPIDVPLMSECFISLQYPDSDDVIQSGTTAEETGYDSAA
jgi:hypothetical protein